jgi:hypothetical protein
MNAELDIKTYLKMILIAFYLILWFHTVGCFLLFIVNVEKQWWPALDFINYGNKQWFTLYDPETSQRETYFKMLYTAALTFNLVDICPRTTIEVFLGTIIFLVSALINANLYGSFSVL